MKSVSFRYIRGFNSLNDSSRTIFLMYAAVFYLPEKVSFSANEIRCVEIFTNVSNR